MKENYHNGFEKIMKGSNEAAATMRLMMAKDSIILMKQRKQTGKNELLNGQEGNLFCCVFEKEGSNGQDNEVKFLSSKSDKATMECQQQLGTFANDIRGKELTSLTTVNLLLFDLNFSNISDIIKLCKTALEQIKT
ncbi:hypothetical protein Ancab_034087 [Ancistrocladus abbreviatus]